MISAISSFCKTYNALETDSCIRSDFIQFMKEVIQDLNEIDYESNKMGVILENWSIQRSKFYMEFLRIKALALISSLLIDLN